MFQTRNLLKFLLLIFTSKQVYTLGPYLSCYILYFLWKPSLLSLYFPHVRQCCLLFVRVTYLCAATTLKGHSTDFMHEIQFTRNIFWQKQVQNDLCGFRGWREKANKAVFFLSDFSKFKNCYDTKSHQNPFNNVMRKINTCHFFLPHECTYWWGLKIHRWIWAKRKKNDGLKPTLKYVNTIIFHLETVTLKQNGEICCIAHGKL